MYLGSADLPSTHNAFPSTSKQKHLKPSIVEHALLAPRRLSQMDLWECEADAIYTVHSWSARVTH